MSAVASPSTFAKRLQTLREAAGVSQYKLAELSGLSKQALSQLEKGDREPSWETVQKLAKGLGVQGKRVETAEDLARELEHALAQPGPRLIEAVL